MDETQVNNTPKKGVVINIMFPCENDSDAITIKAGIDKVMATIKDKKINFQIIES